MNKQNKKRNRSIDTENKMIVVILEVGGWGIKKFYSAKILHILKPSLRYWDPILCLPSFETFFIDHISLIFILSYFSTFSYSIEDAYLSQIFHICPAMPLHLHCIWSWMCPYDLPWAMKHEQEAGVTSRLTFFKKSCVLHHTIPQTEDRVEQHLLLAFNE